MAAHPCKSSVRHVPTLARQEFDNRLKDRLEKCQRDIELTAKEMGLHYDRISKCIQETIQEVIFLATQLETQNTTENTLQK